MIRVVVVEDEFYVRKGIIQTFDWKSLDCEIVGEASNGKQGIEVIEEMKPDLVIADIEMPVVDGIEMVKMLRSKQCGAEFIFLTAHQKFTYVHSALKLEAVDYLLKPFHYKDLEECIRKVKIKLHKIDEETSKTVLLTDEEIQAENIYIKKAIAYVREHYTREIMVSDVAEYLKISEAYFCRLFKKETGYTFGQYLTNYRVHVAAGLLANFPMKVSEAAEQVGFTDSNYFSTIFKKIMEMSPSEYQEIKKVY
ncbi:response regulator [Clostridium sp. MCC353]|uniref:response regulator transcription factor n=1 Tax=Clostridium sp. MCC353 TaxID=2592646 RepID=UPI001C03183F|nr:response regulator [Clostridium sp. MCC353]MBT9779213.1 response regulator [Clostridium sp. MCC353]